jgi:cytidine deaminase
MQKTGHSLIRMNQRGITAAMIDLVMNYGEPEGDKTTLSAKTCRQAIDELKQTQKKLEHAIKKGGLTVVSCNDTIITTYRANSFSSNTAIKSRG